MAGITVSFIVNLQQNTFVEGLVYVLHQRLSTSCEYLWWISYFYIVKQFRVMISLAPTILIYQDQHHFQDGNRLSFEPSRAPYFDLFELGPCLSPSLRRWGRLPSLNTQPWPLSLRRLCILTCLTFRIITSYLWGHRPRQLSYNEEAVSDSSLY